MKNETYVVAPGRIASHSGDGKYYREGEAIDLSHLNEQQLADVLASGLVIKKAAEKHAAVTKEASDG